MEEKKDEMNNKEEKEHDEMNNKEKNKEDEEENYYKDGEDNPEDKYYTVLDGEWLEKCQCNACCQKDNHKTKTHHGDSCCFAPNLELDTEKAKVPSKFCSVNCEIRAFNFFQRTPSFDSLMKSEDWRLNRNLCDYKKMLIEQKAKTEQDVKINGLFLPNFLAKKYNDFRDDEKFYKIKNVMELGYCYDPHDIILKRVIMFNMCSTMQGYSIESTASGNKWLQSLIYKDKILAKVLMKEILRSTCLNFPDIACHATFDNYIVEDVEDDDDEDKNNNNNQKYKKWKVNDKALQ